MEIDLGTSAHQRNTKTQAGVGSAGGEKERH
jgi:hypothetical protein